MGKRIKTEWMKDAPVIEDAERERKARYSETHKEEKKASRKKYYAKQFGISLDDPNADDEYKKAVSSRMKEIHKELDEKRTDEEKALARAKHAQYQREWKAKNPGKVLEQRDRYRERKNQLQNERWASLSEEEKEQEREKWREYKRIKKREERARKKALETQKPATPTHAHASKYPDPSAGYAEAVADASVRTGVVILQGQYVDFNSAWGFADADLRALVVMRLPSTATEQELMDAYCVLHYERYGQEFDF